MVTFSAINFLILITVMYQEHLGQNFPGKKKHAKINSSRKARSICGGPFGVLKSFCFCRKYASSKRSIRIFWQFFLSDCRETYMETLWYVMHCQLEPNTKVCDNDPFKNSVLCRTRWGNCYYQSSIYLAMLAVRSVSTTAW